MEAWHSELGKNFTYDSTQYWQPEQKNSAKSSLVTHVFQSND